MAEPTQSPTAAKTDLRTPLARVRGMGSARHGAEHWWAERLSGIALVPLTLWFVVEILRHVGAGYGPAHAWLSSLWVAGPALLLVLATFHHAALGMQVVIEDYIHKEGTKLLLIVAVKGLAIVAAAVGVLSILKVALGR